MTQKAHTATAKPQGHSQEQQETGWNSLGTAAAVAVPDAEGRTASTKSSIGCLRRADP